MPVGFHKLAPGGYDEEHPVYAFSQLFIDEQLLTVEEFTF